MACWTSKDTDKAKNTSYLNLIAKLCIFKKTSLEIGKGLSSNPANWHILILKEKNLRRHDPRQRSGNNNTRIIYTEQPCIRFAQEFSRWIRPKCASKDKTSGVLTSNFEVKQGFAFIFAKSQRIDPGYNIHNEKVNRHHWKVYERPSRLLLLIFDIFEAT